MDQEFLRENFPATPLLDYALEVEKITTSKKPNLILNVDGIIGVAFVDLLRHSGCFTRYVVSLFLQYDVRRIMKRTLTDSVCLSFAWL